MGLNACFQSVMKASYVMKAARHGCTHNHSCILLGYGLLVVLIAGDLHVHVHLKALDRLDLIDWLDGQKLFDIMYAPCTCTWCMAATKIKIK